MKTVIKKCRKCGLLAEHNWRKDRHTARSLCRKCDSESRMEWRKKNIPVAANLRELKRLAVNRLGGKCEICGIADECAAIFDFHHENEKETAIAAMMAKYAGLKSFVPNIDNYPVLLTELGKCALLCAVCHRRITHCDDCKR
jgi:hypothetical protein